MFSCNTFFIFNDKSNVICVDPGDNSANFIKFITENDLKIKAILLTHGHFDHIRGLKTLINLFGNIPVVINENDLKLLFDNDLNCFNDFDINSFEHISENYENFVLTNNDEQIDLLNFKINVIFTPFHTEGCNSYYFNNEKILFSGDTLFEGTIGRTDLITSCPKYVNSSLFKLKKLDDDVKVLPGHGENTTIGDEKINNFYL